MATSRQELRKPNGRPATRGILVALAIAVVIYGTLALGAYGVYAALRR